jgi:hypothetical protein
MIKIRGKIVTFTGKDAKRMKMLAGELGLSAQDTLTGCLWEHIMLLARRGVFLEKAKDA